MPVIGSEIQLQVNQQVLLDCGGHVTRVRSLGVYHL